MADIIKNNILCILAFAKAADSRHKTKGGTCMCPINLLLSLVSIVHIVSFTVAHNFESV